LRHIGGAEAVRQAQSVVFTELRLVRRSKQKESQGTPRRHGRPASKRTKIIFHLSTSRRAVYCCGAMESMGLAHRGRLR
jgi:hypothetical protein